VAELIHLEEAVIGILLRNPDVVSKFELDERHFHKWAGAVAAIKQLSAKGIEIDAFSLSEQLNSKTALSELVAIHTQTFAATENLAHYVNKLRDNWRSTQLNHVLHSSMIKLNEGDEVSEVISELMQSVLETSEIATKKHSFTINEAMGDFFDRLEVTFDARDTGGIGIKTGIIDVDKVLGGLHPSDMVVVGARPGVGKTSYAASVLLNIAKAGKRVGFVSSEMSASQVMLRLTALESDIAGHKLRDADLDELDWSRLTATTSRLAALNVRIYDKPAITSADVMMQCKAWMIDGGIDFVVIDYLTRIKSVKSIGNQNLDVGEVVTTMKNIARTLNIPVMVLAQLNRDAANRRPVMSDLRDSGIIEQEADQILMLYRDKDDELAPAEIIIEKNRHGESMCIVQCHFDRKTMRWANIARGNDD
jgi:replicative DNA helicase